MSIDKVQVIFEARYPRAKRQVSLVVMRKNEKQQAIVIVPVTQVG